MLSIFKKLYFLECSDDSVRVMSNTCTCVTSQLFCENDAWSFFNLSWRRLIKYFKLFVFETFFIQRIQWEWCQTNTCVTVVASVEWRMYMRLHMRRICKKRTGRNKLRNASGTGGPNHTYWPLNWNTSKGNQAPIQKIERPNKKIPESELCFTSVKYWCPSSLESSMKQILWIFELNQNKWKSMMLFIS